MKPHEIREMKHDELVKQIDEEQKNLMDLRFSHQLKQLTNTGKLKVLKKEIARMKTILHEGEISGVSEAASNVNKEGDNA